MDWLKPLMCMLFLSVLTNGGLGQIRCQGGKCPDNYYCSFKHYCLACNALCCNGGSPHNSKNCQLHCGGFLEKEQCPETPEALSGNEPSQVSGNSNPLIGVVIFLGILCIGLGATIVLLVMRGKTIWIFSRNENPQGSDVEAEQTEGLTAEGHPPTEDSTQTYEPTVGRPVGAQINFEK